MGQEQNLPRDLGNGLVLRQATIEDTDALAALNAQVHREEGATEPNPLVEAWTRDLMTDTHPTFRVGDFTVVEDTSTGAIVSSCNLISQTWTYEGVKFGVGRPELVGTHPDYRNRGLVRAQFDLLHQWSAERGEKLQAITGIPFYYRQFGYEMGLALGGGRVGYRPHVPDLKEGEAEPYHLRDATTDDVPFMQGLYDCGNRRSMIACARDEDLWHYELQGRSEKSLTRRVIKIIETLGGEPVGMFAHPPFLWSSVLVVTLYELEPGTSWVAVTPTVVRYLKAAGEKYAAQEKKPEWGGFGFWLGTDHPAYEAFGHSLPRTRNPYAWYVRVPDIVDFIRCITPVLEKRLEESAASGYTGRVEVSFYRDGLALIFNNGKISVEPWMPTVEVAGAAAFPNLTFLQLLFGYRSLEELEYAYADCTAREDGAHLLLRTLFPKKPSNVHPVEWA